MSPITIGRQSKSIIRKNRNLSFGVVVAFGALSLSANAQQTFLLPENPEGETVSVSLTSALSFPNMEHGPAKDRIAYYSVSIGGQPVDDILFEESETALKMQFETSQAVAAVVAISSKPRAGEIPPDDVETYLDEIEASDAVRAAFDALPGSPALQRSYSKHAKTFFCTETCDGADNLSSPVGQKLEFIAPVSEKRSFQLLLDGEPLAGKQVTIVSFDGEASTAETNEEGIVHVNQTESGMVLLSAVWITLPDQPDGVYHSDYATLTINLDQLP